MLLSNSHVASSSFSATYRARVGTLGAIRQRTSLRPCKYMLKASQALQVLPANRQQTANYGHTGCQNASQKAAIPRCGTKVRFPNPREVTNLPFFRPGTASRLCAASGETP
jgi:hypothetical protein